jgi:hypothetical protein
MGLGRSPRNLDLRRLHARGAGGLGMRENSKLPPQPGACQRVHEYINRHHPHLRRHSPPCSPYEGQHSAQAVPSGTQRLHGASVHGCTLAPHGESKPAELGPGARA